MREPRRQEAPAPARLELADATPERPVRLGAYDVTGLLGRGGMGNVYAAVHSEHGVRVALKTLRHVDPRGLALFKAEFRCVAGLSHPNLVPLYELGCEGDLWFFTMERIDGADLLTGIRGDQSTVRGTPETRTGATTWTTLVDESTERPRRETLTAVASLPPSLPRLRDAFSQLTRGVLALHEAGFVHRDLKPNNVLCDPSGRVVVLDFGLVQAIEAAPAPFSPGSARAHRIAGTPAWMAPEQFEGRSGEPADWYAVGLMLYEALTGVAPFTRSYPDATWYARLHLAPQPPHQILACVPADLSALALALLRADPAERPTGAAVLEILSTDATSRARVATRLARTGFVGREAERELLRAALQRARARGGVVVHVTGPSGVGKSALLRSFADEARDDGALVLGGRCYERETVPYKGFDGVVDALAAHLASELRGRTPAADGPRLPAFIAELARVFPALGAVPAIAARQDPADGVEVSVIELRRRAVAAVRELLVSLAAVRPLVLQIDDLQWADPDSAALLISIVDAAIPGLLVAVTFRREEASTSTALAPYLARAGAGGEIVSIDVGALPTVDAEELASATLRALRVAPQGLAAAIAAESGGIPFFVEELAHYLARHGERSPGVAPSMDGVGLSTVLARRVRELPDAERALVEALSVANSPIPIAVWFSVAGVDAGHDGGSEALRALWALRGSHFVRSTGARAEDRIELHHDRMRAAVLRVMSDDQIVDYHLRLGRALAVRHEEEASPWLFDAVRHLGAAAGRLTDPERIDTARLDLLAGQRAKRAAAFPLAFDCFRAGVALLGDDAWDAHYELALALHSGAAESAYLSDAGSAVDAHVTIVRARGRTILDQLVAREVQIDAAIARGEYDAALDAALLALRLLDVDLPQSPGDAEIGAAVGRAMESLARVGPSGLLALPLATDPVVTAAMRLTSRISSAAYFARPALFPILACELVATSVARGLSPATPYALSVHGVVLNAMGRFRDAHTWGQVALDLLARIADRSHEARTRHVVHDLVCVFTVPLASTLDDLRAVVAVGKETGDLEYAAYAAHAYVHNAFYAGRELGALHDEAAALGAFMRSHEQVNALHVHVPFEQAIRAFLGRTADPATLDGEAFQEDAALARARAVGSRSAQCIVRLLMGIVRLHFGRALDAVTHLEEARPFLDGVVSTWHVPMFHQYAAIAIWASPESEALHPRAEESLAALCTFAEHGPDNFAHRVALALAMRARAGGDPSAPEAFERAIAGAAANGFVADEGLAHELFARHLHEQGDAEGASLHAAAARDAHARWGASAKLVAPSHAGVSSG